MSLSQHEQQALDSLEHQLAASDRRLASLLATFTRLTDGEEFPAREKIQAGWRRATWPRRGARCQCRAGGRRPRSQLVWPLLWLAVSITFIAVALVLSHGGGSGACTHAMAVWTPACISQAPASTASHTARKPPAEPLPAAR